MLGFKQAFRLWRRRRQHRERGKAALEQSGWRSAVQAQSERSATRSAISAPRTMRLGADERYPLRVVQLQRATRPRRSSSNPAALVLAPVPTRSSGSQLARRQSVGSWDHLRGNPTALRRAV